jgi:hypothetical protein
MMRSNFQTCDSLARKAAGWNMGGWKSEIPRIPLEFLMGNHPISIISRVAFVDLID